MKNYLLGHSNSYHGFSLEDALNGISSAGFKYIELSAVKGWTEHVSADMSDAELSEVKALLEKYGLTAIGLSGHCNLMEEQRLDDFRANIKLAAKLGCKYIITSTGEAHFGENETFSNEALIRNIRSLLPALEENGVILTIEIHGAEYGTGESLYEITRAIDSPLVGINYDTANVLFYGGKLPTDDIKTCFGDVNYVHVKDHSGPKNDWNFPGAGNGDLPLREFLEYMVSNGYEGPFSVEIEYTQDFCMRDKDQTGDIDVANKEMADSYKFLTEVLR